MTSGAVTHEPSALPPGTIDPGRIESFEGSGGRLLRYRVVASQPTRYHLLYLHGIESHSAWFLPAAASLRELGFTTYLLDRRGSGLNMNPLPGDAPSARVLLEDVRRFRRQLGDLKLHLLGLSWGGKLAAAVALDQPEALQSLILITPGLRSRRDLSLSSKANVLLNLLVGGRSAFKVPIEPEMFTHTPRFLDFIRSDPWRLQKVTARFFLTSRALDRMITKKIADLRLPILLFLAGKDPIIDNRGVQDLLSKNEVRVRIFDDAIHAIQFDQMERMVREIGSFIEEVEPRC
jgi:pimeloyl-ACP methyl ester carboxylesterase